MTNFRMKNKLMLQFLSPLAVLTMIRNFEFEIPKDFSLCSIDSWMALLVSNRILMFVMVLCMMWLIAAIESFVSFSAFVWTGKEQGYEIKNVQEKEDASLNFFMTMVIPLLIDDVGTIQGALTFLIIVILMIMLLGKTNLFYANPVLAILGYRVYEFTFVENSTFDNNKCIGVARGRLSKDVGSVEYEVISDAVVYTKEMKR